MNPFFWQAQRVAWKAQQAAWKAQRNAWRAERKLAHAHWRARHPRSFFGFVWGLMWAFFWVGLVFYFVFGGPEARQNLYQIFHAAVDIAKTVVQEIAAALGAVQ